MSNAEETNKKLADIYSKLEEQKKDIKEHKEGDKGEGTIIEIELGLVKHFISEENLSKWKGNIDTDCLQMHIKNPDGQVIKQVMTFSPHPNSNMQRWVKSKGKYPEINDKVQMRHDGNFWQLV